MRNDFMIWFKKRIEHKSFSPRKASVPTGQNENLRYRLVYCFCKKPETSSFYSGEAMEKATLLILINRSVFGRRHSYHF